MSISENKLNPGDHIYVRRRGLLYSHHGIYSGEGNVIHFKGAVKEKRNPSVRETDMQNFLKGGKLKRRDYKKRLPLADTYSIARAHLNRKGYSLAFNNCEHFAAYCTTGKKKSTQIRKVLSGIAGVTLAVTAAFIRKKNHGKKGNRS